LLINFKKSRHPERPERIESIIKGLKDKGLYDRCIKLEPRFANENELLLCHDKKYIEEIRCLKNTSSDELIQLSKNTMSVYYHWDTFICASIAAGCLLQVIDAVCSKKVTTKS
jgi:acetoin utilization deacetylase AcuC-like enzyme